MMNWHLRGFEDKFYIWAMWWIMAIGGAMMLATHVVAGNTKVTKFDRVILSFKIFSAKTKRIFW